MPLFHFSEPELLAFALVLLRVSAFVVSWPVFSVYSVPQHAKILFALVLTVCLFPSVHLSGLSVASLNLDLAWLALKEVCLGLCLAFFTRMLFFSISIAGNLISTSMGLGSAQMFNPTLNIQSSTVEEFLVIIATLMFLGLNGHHTFLLALAKSFELLPLSPQGADLAVLSHMGGLVQNVCLAGLRISAPIMVTVFFMNMAMGIIGRAVPQINVLVTSLPINIMVSLVVLILMIPLFVNQMDDLMESMSEQMMFMMKSL